MKADAHQTYWSLSLNRTKARDLLLFVRLLLGHLFATGD